MAGVYIHIPFCKQACTYCDFHFSTSLENKNLLVKSICQEIELRKNYLENETLESIYFGGGTPSLLNEFELQEIFDVLKKHFNWSTNIEITLECNPDDLNKEKLLLFKKTGINRLSIGLQSFNDEELKWMNRAHSAEESETSVKLATDLGFSNITIDLIYGSKFQSIENWMATLEKAVALNVSHISSYNLTVETKTKLSHDILKGKEPKIDEDKSALYFSAMVDYLEKNKFEHYEISNFGKAGFIAVHNSNYWKGKKYLGIGPSAHSYNGINRRWNVSNNNLYITSIKNGTAYFEEEILSVKNKYDEYVLTGLRTKWGCNTDFINDQFGAIYKTHFLKSIQKYLQNSVVESHQTFTLTKTGKLLADKIAMELFY